MRRLVATCAAVLAGGAVALGAPGTGTPSERARSTALSASGSFTQSNSRDGMPVFSAANLGPGDAAAGSVTIANRGTLGGNFTLSAFDVSDLPGPNGGLLSDRLRLTVDDVTAPGTAVRVYAGALASMPARPLGHFAAAETRSYRFTAAVPDGGSPPSAAGGDNAFAGSVTRVSFRWAAVEAAAPPPRSGSGTGAAFDGRDRRPPRLRLSIPRVQRVLTRGYMTLRARCSETCRIGVTGTVRIGRGRAGAVRPVRARRIERGRTATLRVRLPRRARGPVLRRALLADRTITVRLRIAARDAAGNRAVARRTVRLSRR